MKTVTLISQLIIPFFVLLAVAYGAATKVRVYDSFVSGAKEGLGRGHEDFPLPPRDLRGGEIFPGVRRPRFPKRALPGRLCGPGDSHRGDLHRAHKTAIGKRLPRCFQSHRENHRPRFYCQLDLGGDHGKRRDHLFCPCRIPRGRGNPENPLPGARVCPF